MKKYKLKFTPGAIFLIAYQVLLILTLPIYFYYGHPKLSMAIAAFILFWLSGISITAGYHRYFAHRSYKANPIVEFFLVYFGSMAIQGSVLRWSFDHRQHHAFVDTDKDPYSIKKGFWYAHFLWIMDEPKPFDPKVVSDLLKNKLVMFQDRYAVLWMLSTNLLAFLVLGFLLHDFWGAFFLATWTRIFFLHHFTWFINSLAHTWGDRPFCQEQTAVDNFIISLVTFGEGYHNYHHTYANDYRNGVRWFHFDPSKWMIWTLSKLGLTCGLRKMDYVTINKRMVLERKLLLITRLKNLWYVKRDELELKINEISEGIVEKTVNFKKLTETYYRVKREKVQKEMLKSIREEMKSLKKSIKRDWAAWRELSYSIMKLKPLKQ